MSDNTLPKFFKDSSGYCYTATPLLAKESHLTPWNGDIDARGFAVESKPAKPAKAAKAEVPSAE